MKFCPNPDCDQLVRHGAIAEFQNDAEVCSDCGAKLQTGEAPQARPESVVYRELETIYQAANAIQAHLIRDILEGDDIPVHIRGESLVGAIGELPATVAQLEIQVPPKFALRARELALQFEAGAMTEVAPI